MVFSSKLSFHLLHNISIISSEIIKTFDTVVINKLSSISVNVNNTIDSKQNGIKILIFSLDTIEIMQKKNEIKKEAP